MVHTDVQAEEGEVAKDGGASSRVHWEAEMPLSRTNPVRGKFLLLTLTQTRSCLGKKGCVSAYSLQSIMGQELKQRSQRDTAFWLVFFGLLNYLSFTA